MQTIEKTLQLTDKKDFFFLNAALLVHKTDKNVMGKMLTIFKTLLGNTISYMILEYCISITMSLIETLLL